MQHGRICVSIWRITQSATVHLEKFPVILISTLSVVITYSAAPKLTLEALMLPLNVSTSLLELCLHVSSYKLISSCHN